MNRIADLFVRFGSWYPGCRYSVEHDSQEWADQLAGFSDEDIQNAVAMLRSGGDDRAPALPRFATLCASAKKRRMAGRYETGKPVHERITNKLWLKYTLTHGPFDDAMVVKCNDWAQGLRAAHSETWGDAPPKGDDWQIHVETMVRDILSKWSGITGKVMRWEDVKR